jgi:hypothetical protein
MVVHAYNPSYSGGRERRIKFEGSQSKVSKTLSQKQNIKKRAGSVAQVIECLLSRSRVQSQYREEKKEKKHGVYIICIWFDLGLTLEVECVIVNSEK